MKIQKNFIAMCIAFVFLCTTAKGNGLNLNSLGTRAHSMGGAFVGLADDFSTIYWNPAGMGFFKQRYFGLSGTAIIPNSYYQLSLPIPPMDIHIVDARTENNIYLSGMLAYYHPIGKNFIAGLGVYTPSKLGAAWDGADLVAIANLNPNIEWSSKVEMVTITPGIAYNLNDILFIGAAMNINYGMFNIAMHAGTAHPVQDILIDLGQYKESMDGWGYGATFGILVRPNKILSLGATFRTASRMAFSGEASISNLSTLGFIMGGYDTVESTHLEREITWPLWIAGGFAIHPVQYLTVTADIQYTQWSRTHIKPFGAGDINSGLGGHILTNYKDTFWKIMIDPLRPMFWEDTLQLRFGVEYSVKSFALRGGYYWDPSPIPDSTMSILFPSYDFNVFTLGLGYSLKGLQLDIGLEYSSRKERNIPVSKAWGDPFPDPDWKFAMPGVHQMHIVAPSLSLSYKF